MRRSRVFALLSLLTITAARAASAQLCAGMAPFSAGPVRVAAVSQFLTDQKMFGGAVALGAANGTFGGAYVGQTSFKDVSENGTNYGGHLGFSAPVDQAKKVEVCPMATLDAVSADFDFGFGPAQIRGARYGLSFGIGGAASTSETFEFVPFASIAYNHASSKATLAGTTDKATDDFGILSFGAGLVLNKVVTLQPNVLMQFGTDNNDTIYGVTVAFNFGKRK